uniref:Uncharacterized protein n=1 Tax=Oryza nivara TaxID=4536 RepID=A0A0E0IND7_ORYNI
MHRLDLFGKNESTVSSINEAHPGRDARPGGGARLGAATVAWRRDAARGGGGDPAAGSGTWQGGGGSGGAPPGSGIPAAGSDSRMARVVMAGVAGDGRTARAEGQRMCDGRTLASRSMRAAPCSRPTRQWLAPAMLVVGLWMTAGGGCCQMDGCVVGDPTGTPACMAAAGSLRVACVAALQVLAGGDAAGSGVELGFSRTALPSRPVMTRGRHVGAFSSPWSSSPS